jgi:hypothetical protein
MGRLKARAAQRRRQEQQQQQATFWPELCRRIDAGDVIPIVSNAVFFDQIFDIDGDGILGVSPGAENPRGWSIEEQLADAWAAEIGFPWQEQERPRLARVALYNRVVKSADDRGAKASFLNWLKDALLILAEEDPDVDPDTGAEQRDEIEHSGFADIAVELGYPRAVSGQPDALAQLARLKLPIYLTTSYFDFLERAIVANGRAPRTQICFWSGEPLRYAGDGHRTDYDFKPSVEQPLVYHLFGHEAYPGSLVLTEDDYLDFLAAIAQVAHQQQQPLLPGYLHQALTKSSLLLLGYRPHDWDFRILFRGLINSTPSALRQMVNLAVQLDPTDQEWVVAAADIKRYLEDYFHKKERQLNFTVEYGTTGGFVAKLWEAWDQWRR